MLFTPDGYLLINYHVVAGVTRFAAAFRMVADSRPVWSTATRQPIWPYCSLAPSDCFTADCNNRLPDLEPS